MKCPHCGHEADTDRTSCPLCGTPLRGGQPGEPARDGEEAAGEAGRPSGEGAGEDGSLTPWEEGGGLAALAASWWESLVDPSRFFERLDWGGGLELPVLYYLVLSVVGAGFQAVWSVLLPFPEVSGIDAGHLLAGASGVSLPLLQFFVSPFSALFGLAVAVAFLHTVSRLLSEEARPIGATTRVLCYAAGPQVLLAVPRVGGLAAIVWSAVITVLGIRAAHDTSTARAAAILGISFVLGMTLLTILVAIVIASGAIGSLPIPR